MSNKAKRLGEFLVARGVITQGQLNEVLAQRSSDELLGVLLMRRGWITEDQLLTALSEQSGIPRVRLSEEQIDWNVASQFSASLLAEQSCFPLRQDRDSVTVAITNPLDAWTISALEREARGRHVKLMLVSSKEISSAIQEHHRRAFRKVERSLDKGHHVE